MIEYIKNALPLLINFILIILPSWQLIITKDKPLLKRITPVGWILIFAAIGNQFLASNDYKILTRTQYILAEYPIRVVHRDTVTKHHDIRSVNNPIIDLVPNYDGRANPRLETFPERDSFSIAVNFTVINDFVATDLRDKMITFKIINNKIDSIQGFSSRAFSVDDKLYKDIQKGILAGFKMKKDRPSIPSDTMFSYIKVSYRNDKNQEQSPLRKIFYVYGLSSGLVKDLRGPFEPINHKERERIKSMLIRKRLW